MAKKQQPVEGDARKRKPVDLDPDLHKKVAVIAAALEMSIPDYVNNRLRPLVERELPKALEQLGMTED